VILLGAAVGAGFRSGLPLECECPLASASSFATQAHQNGDLRGCRGSRQSRFSGQRNWLPEAFVRRQGSWPGKFVRLRKPASRQLRSIW